MKVDSLWLKGGEQESVEVNEETITRNQVEVGAWGVGTEIAESEQGWNCLAQPFLTSLDGDDYSVLMAVGEEEVRYVTIPSYTFDDYVQLPVAEASLLPFSCFFIQAATTGVISFDAALRQAVPARYAGGGKEEQVVYLSVSDDKSSDRIGLLIDSRYSSSYDFNADLSKELGTAKTLRLYFEYDDMRMAYLALNEKEAMDWIPVSIRVPQKGEYSVQIMTQSKTEQLKHIYLKDTYAKSELDLSDMNNYRFYANEGVLNDRFFVKVVHQSMPTEIVNTTIDSQARKYISNGMLLIDVNGRLYDGMGKVVE